jgi:galactose mutarotase-like enzyme
LNKLSNEILEVQLSVKGAELQSIYNRKEGLEYLWQGDPEFWARRSPVLFPIVGALKDDTYVFEGQEYKMGQHGFARNLDFKVSTMDAFSITYLLVSSEETRKNYPFDFEFSVTYTLHSNQLKICYLVRNTGANVLWYSVGGHPAFNCPMHAHEQRSDYHLAFDSDEQLDRQIIEKGIRTGEKRSVLKNEKVIALTKDLFDEDALIFEKPKSSAIQLLKNDKPYVKLDFADFEYLGIWSKNRDSPFVCIEPWIGIADHINHNQELETKEGIKSLESSELHNYTYTITFY